MIEPISFWVSGEPKGQPRPRAFARKFGDKWQARVYDAKTAEGWKSQIAIAWRENQPVGFVKYEGPVCLTINFNLPRPKSHFLKSGLRTDAPTFCCKKPDVDNFAKAVMDAMTQLGIWNDDCQVCTLRVSKVFASGAPGARIEIHEEAI